MKVKNFLELISSNNVSVEDELVIQIKPQWISSNEAYSRCHDFIVNNIQLSIGDIEIKRKFTIDRKDIIYSLRVSEELIHSVKTPNTLILSFTI